MLTSNIWIIVLSIASSYLIACLISKFGSHTLINGFMSKKMADAVFPWWRKQKNLKSDKNKEK